MIIDSLSTLVPTGPDWTGLGRYKTWTLDWTVGLDYGIAYGLDFELDFVSFIFPGIQGCDYIAVYTQR